MYNNLMPNQIETVILAGNGDMIATSNGDYKQALEELKRDMETNYTKPEDVEFANKILQAIEKREYTLTENDTCITFDVVQ